jgi:hypothetical protein
MWEFLRRSVEDDPMNNEPINKSGVIALRYVPWVGGIIFLELCSNLSECIRGYQIILKRMA